MKYNYIKPENVEKFKDLALTLKKLLYYYRSELGDIGIDQYEIEDRLDKLVESIREYEYTFGCLKKGSCLKVARNDGVVIYYQILNIDEEEQRISMESISIGSGLYQKSKRLEYISSFYNQCIQENIAEKIEKSEYDKINSIGDEINKFL